jgi:penicillin-binding protein 2
MKPGFAFGEHIKTEKIKRRNYEDGPRSFRMRSFLLPFFLAIILVLVGWKLFTLQIVQGSYYRGLADSNRIRTQIIHAPRGVIFDRNGTPLVYNIPGFRQTTKDKNGTSKTTILNKEDALQLIAKGNQNIEVDSLRQYPFKDAMAQALGYIGQISKDELENSQFSGYLANDWLGKSGIERKYEHRLRGTDGKELVEVDAMGKQIRFLGQTDPIPGEDITLTLDAKLQQAVYNAAKNIKKGAIIASTPDGQILAMVSKPSFDPNLFTLDKTYKPSPDSPDQTVSSILLDSQNQPLLDRAIAGVYPPGSTFKIVAAATGLEKGVIDQNYRVTDTGILKLGDFSFANWYYTEYGRKEPGDLDITRAIARSNDIFFYKLAEKIGVDRLSNGAEQFGLGRKLGIDLGGEQDGLVPTTEWKQQNLHEDWYLGDTYHYGIGQGYLLTTPLQVNAWTQAIANEGTLYQPHLLKEQKAKIENQNLLNEKNFNLIRQGMIEACSTGGVAWPLFDFGVKNPKLTIDGKDFLPMASSSADMRKVTVACKTGTAEHGGEDTLPHAWITLFAPAYNPQIVLTVLVESSGEGSNVAAPVAKEILEKYFEE